MPLTLTSDTFRHGEPIPARCTCQGDDRSPGLAWRGAPDGTRSYVLIVEDPDAPDPAAPKLTWVHWVLYDLPADCPMLPEGVDPAALPPGTREGITNRHDTGYHGPCPPIGRHRYFHRLYALDTVLGDLGRPTAAALRTAMRGHILAETELMGTYQQ